MISQRTSGLHAVLALCQMGLTACLFWAEFFILFVSLGDKTSWLSYAAYCAVLLFGLFVGKRSATGASMPPPPNAAISSTPTA